MRVVIQDDYEKMCKWAADYIADKINNHKEDRPFVLGLPTGSSPIGVYKNLIAKNKAGELSFKNVVTFNMDEYLGLPHEHDQSYWYFMHDNFFDHLVSSWEASELTDTLLSTSLSHRSHRAQDSEISQQIQES